MEQEPMRTRTWQTDATHPDVAVLAEAAEVLRQGGIVAFPTETVYGLGADGTSEKAVARVFSAKGRPADNPVILHVGRRAWVDHLVREVPTAAEALMERFWPGPLTLVMERGQRVPDIVTAGLPGVAIRMPAHPVALALIRLVERPLAAPSANRSGRPSPTRAAHVARDLAGHIDGILDGGPCQVGLESTVLDVRRDPPVILRHGAVTREMLLEHLPAVGEHVGGGAPPESPGLKYRHYAPDVPLEIVGGPPAERHRALKEARRRLSAEGKRVAFLVTEEAQMMGPDVYLLGTDRDPATIAASLYGHLRTADDSGYDRILVEGVEESGLGRAVMDRLRRAAEAPPGRD
ncbi:MAG: threonylcarbamoyl-AMP synthase [Euryarchaeota archaeon]|nr:threonylcarbamoyl-AMP synthase [Euryarchaeota archaeon]